MHPSNCHNADIYPLNSIVCNEPYFVVAAIDCGENATFSYSASACPNTCADPNAEENCPSVIAGCTCIEDHVLSGDKCMCLDSCGCKVGNLYYMVCI